MSSNARHIAGAAIAFRILVALYFWGLCIPKIEQLTSVDSWNHPTSVTSLRSRALQSAKVEGFLHGFYGVDDNRGLPPNATLENAISGMKRRALVITLGLVGIAVGTLCGSRSLIIASTVAESIAFFTFAAIPTMTNIPIFAPLLLLSMLFVDGEAVDESINREA